MCGFSAVCHLMYGDTLRFDGLTALSKVEGRVRKVSPAGKAPSPSPLPPGEGKGEGLRRSFSYRNINSWRLFVAALLRVTKEAAP